MRDERVARLGGCDSGMALPPVGSCKANQRGKGIPGKVVSTSKGREAQIPWVVSRLARAMTGTSRHMAPGQLMFLFIRVLCHPASSCIWGQGRGYGSWTWNLKDTEALGYDSQHNSGQLNLPPSCFNCSPINGGTCKQ